MVGDADFAAAIETLTARGVINSGDVKKLQDAGIDSLMMLTKNTLTDVVGLSKDKVDIIWEAAENILVARASKSADKNSLQFPLGIKAYDLKSKIGFGSRGAIVYKAYCKQIKSSVAIKMYNHGHGANAGDANSNALSPNLLTMSSFSVDWVVMPLMPYGSLRSILYSSFPQGLPESFACFFLSQILKGMLHLHPQDVIITAGNVLVDSNGSVKFSHGSVVEHSEERHDFARLAMELIHGYGDKSINEVSTDFMDMVSMARRRCVSELIHHKCFHNLMGNDNIRGFLAALPPLESMAVESKRIIKNRVQTVKNVGRKDLMETLIRKEKRLQDLRTSIAIGSASTGKMSHWNMELESCMTKVENLKRQLRQM